MGYIVSKKFALVGCGRISGKHAEAIQNNLPNASLTCVADIDPTRAKAVGEKYGVPFYDSMHKMMEACGDDIDIVNVLTPSGMHAEHTIELAKYRKHIVVEKPMALTLSDADKMIRACDDAGVKLFVVKQNRFNLPVKKLREAVEKGRFGKMIMGTIRVRWCRPQAYYDQDDWRGTWRYDGGVLTNQASHHIDLLEWMMGDVESVFARSETMLVDIETEDTGVALLKFKNGALGIIEATTATRPKDLEGSISIMGEKGTVEIGGFAVNEMKTWNFLEQESGDESVLGEFKNNPPNVYGFGHVEYLQNVIDSVDNKSSALVDGMTGKKSLELISAIYESIETGKEVKMSFQPKHCRLGMD